MFGGTAPHLWVASGVRLKHVLGRLASVGPSDTFADELPTRHDDQLSHRVHETTRQPLSPLTNRTGQH
jgi:hypothetical protein